MTEIVPHNRLYHYCKLSTAIEYILSNRQLKLSPLINTNDPRENKSFVFGVRYWEWEGFGFNNDINTLNEYVSTQIRSDCKVICFSICGVLDGYQLSQMWAHYGDMHKGVCIEIDYEEFVKENVAYINTGNFKCIEYVNPKSYTDKIVTDRYKQIDFTSKNCTEEFINYIRKRFRIEHKDYLYFTKSVEWEHEQEFRLLHFSNENSNEFCSIKKSLKGIYLGVDFNSKYLPSILTLLEGETVPVWQLNYSGEWIYCHANLNTLETN